MKRNRLAMIVVMAGLAILSSLAWGQVPQMMNYQARLSNSSGEPLDTTIQMVFRIWDDSTGGAEIWTETHNVVVANGGFLVKMGSLTPLSPGIFGQSGRYLGITIGQDQEIAPRTELGSVAFTFKAGTATWATGSDSATIAQTVVPGGVTSLEIQDASISFDDIAPNNATQDGQVMVWNTGRSGWALGSTVTGITASSGLAGGGTGDVTLSIANDGVTSTMIQDGTVATADLALGAVAQGNIANGAVSSGKLTDLAVTSAKLNDLAVTSGKLSDLAVTSGKLSDLAVTGTKIAADAVTDAKIAAAAVTDTKIAAAAVTDAKIASMAVTQSKIAVDAVSTDKIAFQTILFEDIAPNNATQNGEVMVWSAARSGWVLGSTVTGITASSGLAGGGTGDVTLSIANDGVTSTMIQDGTVATADLALGAVAQGNIANGAVSSGKLTDLAVTSAKLNDLAVTSGKLSDLAVTSGKLSDLAVTGTKIAADAVTDAKIAAAAVTDTKIAAAAVTDAKIAAAAVTQAKIAVDAVSTDKIVNGTILLEDLNNNGASDGEVLKWSDLQAGWLPSVDEVGSDVWSQTGDVLFTDGEWGIARLGNILYGLNDSTHVNLGVACTTGAAAPAPYNSKYVTISGGVGNWAMSDGSVIAGGGNNLAGNTATELSTYATVSGGQNNQAVGQFSVVAGGGGPYPSTNPGNKAQGDYSVVGGGMDNKATAHQATIAGGASNYATNDGATVGGGFADTASGAWSTVPGGYGNSAGADYSFAGGYRARVNPLHTGTFVWSGYSAPGLEFASTGPKQFLIRADQGVGIGVNDPTEALDVLGTARLRIMPVGSGQNVVMSGTGVLRKQGSSRRYKENIRSLKVDPDAYSKLQPVRFRWKEQGTEDIGLIAEDVAEVLPDLVIYDDQGRPDAVKYDLLAVILLGTIQNQQERIDQLTTQAETFEQKLSQMQTQMNDMLAQYGSLESDTKVETDKKTGGG